ncbi:hypothetical protein SLA2020_033330 [Shorea laevis]
MGKESNPSGTLLKECEDTCRRSTSCPCRIKANNSPGNPDIMRGEQGQESVAITAVESKYQTNGREIEEAGNFELDGPDNMGLNGAALNQVSHGPTLPTQEPSSIFVFDSGSTSNGQKTRS